MLPVPRAVSARFFLELDIIACLFPPISIVHIRSHPLTVQTGVFRDVVDIEATASRFLRFHTKVIPITVPLSITIAANETVELISCDSYHCVEITSFER